MWAAESVWSLENRICSSNKESNLDSLVALSVVKSLGPASSPVHSCVKYAGLCTYICVRRYVTNLKVAGSRPDEVNDFYQVT
jgi:hypothetical protein